MNGAVRTSGGTVGGTGVPPVISPKAKADSADGQRQARRLSHRLLLAAVLVATLLVFSIARGQQVDNRGLAGDAAQLPGAGAGAVRFAAVNLYVDSGEAPLAAWQIDFRDARGVVRIVGIEGGEHAA